MICQIPKNMSFITMSKSLDDNITASEWKGKPLGYDKV